MRPMGNVYDSRDLSKLSLEVDRLLKEIASYEDLIDQQALCIDINAYKHNPAFRYDQGPLDLLALHAAPEFWMIWFR